MKYCKDAWRFGEIKVVCGIDCPIYYNCPTLILEDALDAAIPKAIEAMFKAVGKIKKEDYDVKR